ncbi:hypothetical protein TQ38_002180 [Novosphingobium sp. P6W]|nr:hypothetical protein TQ38_002180 [Novosphingobium sp. P6W]KIS32508.1 hypothetical protein TQ38_09230 [Novosphingobium sp. P6W]
MSVSVISSLDEDEKLLHGKLLDLADKSVAHCVDGSEENVPIVTMIIPPNAPVSAEISAWNGRVVHHNKVDCDKIRILALKLRAEAKSYATILAEELLKELQGKSLSEIYHMPKPQRSITDNGEQLSLKYGGKLKGDLPPFNFIKGQ